MSIKKTYIPAKPRSSKLVGTSMSGGVAGSISSSSTGPNAHSHSNKVVLDKLTDGDIDVLGKLSLDEDGNIKVDTTLWATGGISALGLGGGIDPGTGGDFDRLDAWVDYNETKANWVLSALLGYDLHTRVNSLEAGGGASNIEIAITGSGNAVTGVSKDGNTLTFAKGSTFALSTHNHDTIYKPIGYVPSWSEITNKPSTFAPSTHTHTIANVTGLQTALDAKEPSFTKNTAFNKNFGTVAGTVMQGNDSRIHSHSNKALLDLITQSNIDVLAKLSIVDGNIKVDTTLWATGGISALGLGSGGGSGGGGVDMLDSWANYTAVKANYYVPASLLVPFRNDTLSRLTSLESGSATSIVTTGSGNAITSLTKSGSVITATKGLTFALASHTHTIAQITGLQGALDLKATQSDITTAIDNIDIGGRNYFRHLFTDSNRGLPIKLVNGWYVADADNYGGFIFSTAYLEEGNTYTISFEYKTTDNSGWYVIGSPRSTTPQKYNSNKTLNLIQDGEVHKKILRITATATEEVSITLAKAGSSGTVYYKENSLKVEKGTKATDWTPAPEDQVSDWSTTDVTSFSFIKNKPTQLSQFTDNIGVATHIANKANPHAVTTAQIGAVDLTTNQTITGAKTFNENITLGVNNFIRGTDNWASVWNVDNLLWRFGSSKAGSVANIRSEKVGIDTDNPLYKLDVSGDGRFTGNVTANNLIISSTSAEKNISFMRPSYNYLTADTVGGSLHFITNGDGLLLANSILNLFNNGSVGIGKGFTPVPPTAQLEVRGTGRFTSSLIAPKVDFGNGFTIEPSGTELVFKYNGVIKQRMLSDGTILATSGITALAT